MKYTGERGRISLDIDVTDSYVEVVVKDTGVGITPEELPHVFDRFWRADSVRSPSMGGAGLGLSIARWIVERHHGSIEVHSETGKGSQFLTRLPLKPSPQLSEEKIVER